MKHVWVRLGLLLVGSQKLAMSWYHIAHQTRCGRPWSVVIAVVIGIPMVMMMMMKTVVLVVVFVTVVVVVHVGAELAVGGVARAVVLAVVLIVATVVFVVVGLCWHESDESVDVVVALFLLVNVQWWFP